MNEYNKAVAQAAAERDQQVRDVLAAQAAGISREQVARLVGITIAEARCSLYRLQYAQEAVFTRNVRGQVGMWCRPELADAVQAEKLANLAETERKRRAHSNKPRGQRLAEKLARQAVEIVPCDVDDDTGEGAKPFTHRVLSAGEAPPVVTRGVPSVFHLGARA